MPPFASRLLLSAAPLASAFAAAPEPPATPLPPLVVTATRVAQDPVTLPLSVDVFTAADLRDTPALTLDDTLRGSAAFSLFRRTGSLTANPTAQGVSLRGIGPSGASRALVLLDGVPVNDPFGGWVAWTKLPAASLERVEIVRGGGSPAWGSSSLGGVVHLLSQPLLADSSAGDNVTHLVTNPPPKTASEPAGNVTQWVTKRAEDTTGQVSATLGDFRTRGAEASATVAGSGGRDAFRLDAAAFATDGVHLVRDPGPIDRPADSEHRRAQLAWAHRLAPAATLTTTVRAWEEERGNGTPYQRNASEELFASATLTGTAVSGPAWSATVYAQDQDYRSTFSAVNADRDAETPASDQYAVPAAAAGVSLQATWGDPAALAGRDAAPGDAVTTLGLDARHVDGETREHYFFTAGDFTRERRAGGAQTVAGLFASHARPLAPGLTLDLAGRLDSTWLADGFRRETTRATGAVLLDEHYADRDDLAFSPRLGLAWRATDTLTARATAYSAYRTPTLNELYRPFRVGPVTTLANPNLDPETLLGGEAGLDWISPERRHGLRATVFQNELSDAVANVTLNATTRQRRNLDAARIRGLELGGHWKPAADLRLEADYLLSDARVHSGGPGAEDLDGKRLAQVPRHTLSAGAVWQAVPALSLDLRARWFSKQYEDDLNTLSLGSATRLDFAAHYAFAARWRLTLAVENLLDAGIETGRTATGVVNVAPPRLARAELSYTW